MEFSGTGTSIKWSPTDAGTYYLRIFDGTYCTSCTQVFVSVIQTTNIFTTTTSTTRTTSTSTTPQPFTTTTSTTSTTIKEEFKMTDIDCSKYTCDIQISKNTINDDVTLITLLKTDSGKIYYISISNVEKGFTGKKPVSMVNKNFCSSGTKLTALSMAYRKNNFNTRLDRIKDFGLIC
ncbi:MAG: hypothetical protein QXY45_03790 [Candidatus Aenigmatarchaeota archaeon]